MQLINALELKKKQEKIQLKTLKTLAQDVILLEMKIRNASIEIKAEQEALPLTPIERKMFSKELIEFDKKMKLALDKEENKNEYTPSNLMRFKDSLARYAYLFEIKYEKNINLTVEDSSWMEQFENSSEYQRNYKNRYETLKEFCKQQIE